MFYEYGVGITAIFLLPVQPSGLEKGKFTCQVSNNQYGKCTQYAHVVVVCQLLFILLCCRLQISHADVLHCAGYVRTFKDILVCLY